MIENNPEELISETEIEDNNLNSPNQYQSDTGNYLTDSDIDDEKYQPNIQKQNNSLYKNPSLNNINQQYQNNNLNEISSLKINKQYENQVNFLKMKL